VGLGSDFDGITETPIGLENCSRTLILGGWAQMGAAIRLMPLRKLWAETY